ncbi:hypothetical protein BH23GEM7_BH23GEM7_21620 [soil metagenome]
MSTTRVSGGSRAAVVLLALLAAAVPLNAQQPQSEPLAGRAAPQIAAASPGGAPLAAPFRLAILPSVQKPQLHVLTPDADVRHRNEAMFNGALIAFGATGIFDNVVNHWILELHRAVPGPYTLQVEIGLVVVSTALLVTGLGLERQARRR